MWKNIMCVIALGWLSTAWAGSSDPIVSRAWIGETMPGQTNATLQLNLTTVKAANLMSVSSPVAESVEIHSLMLHQGAMKVHVVNSLPLADNRTITFGSHGLFLMMKGIKQPLHIGNHVPVSLVFTFANQQTRTIAADAEVRQMDLSYKHYGPNDVYDHH